jgi:hypothetical protein
LLLANGLARPDQFRDILENLEAAETGLKDVAGQGGGHPEFANLLGILGERSRPVGKPFIYDAKGRLERIFDGAPDRTDADDRVPSEPAAVDGDAGYAAKPWRSGLSLPPARRQ